MEFISVTDENLADAVEKLAREIWCEHYTPIIGGSQVAYMVEKFQTALAVLHQITYENYMYYLMRDTSAAWVGYFAVIPRESELFLSKFYIRLECRKHGYGRQAVQFVEKIAHRKKLPKIVLTVSKKNIGSIMAYQKLGFQIAEPVLIDIGGGFFMDDYRMEKRID